MEIDELNTEENRKSANLACKEVEALIGTWVARGFPSGLFIPLLLHYAAVCSLETGKNVWGWKEVCELSWKLASLSTGKTQ